jgi:tetratricopeptide (TPR) repeat protein
MADAAGANKRLWEIAARSRFHYFDRVNFGDGKKTRWRICLALALVTAGLYARVAGFDFVNYDDPDYVTANPEVNQGLTWHGLVWAFTHFHAGNWHPVTWISHMLDCQIFGYWAGGHHLVSVALHAANAVLLFLLLARMTGATWRSAIVAGLFALHPLHVESVAWVAERKDVLSAFFAFLSLLAYVRYNEKSTVHSPQPTVWYACTLVFFALGLMAKPMLVTLPFVMLLLDFWPLGRWRVFASATGSPDPRVTEHRTRNTLQLLLEKLPFFALSAVSCVITYLAQQAGGAMTAGEQEPAALRLSNAVMSYGRYALKAVWPNPLASFYPLEKPEPWVIVLAVGAVLLIVSGVALKAARAWPSVFVGWFWFLGTLVPVIGIVQVGGQAMADRYTYLPLIGLFIIAVWGGAELFRRRGAGVMGGVVAAVALLAFSAITVVQLQYWRDGVALFSHALAVTTDNAVANNDLGSALAAAGRREEALARYQEAVRLDGKNASYQINLATALVRAGRLDEGVGHYLEALQIDPRSGESYSDLGTVYLAEHRLTEAITNLEMAVQLEPESGQARNNLANALLSAGKQNEALEEYRQAVRLSPNDATIHFNTGLVLAKAGKEEEAMEQFMAAERLDPGYAEAHYEIGRRLFLRGDFPAAIEELSEAARLKPNYVWAEFYLAAALAETGRYSDAVKVSEQAAAAAQLLGQSGAVTKIQQAMEFYKAGRPFRPTAPK